MKQMLGSVLRQVTRTRRHFAAALSAVVLFGTATQTHAGDYALSFSAANHTVTSSGKITNLNFTAEAWFKLSSYTAENQIFNQYAAGTGRFIVAIRNTVAGMFIGGTWMEGTVTIPLNTWTHIAVTRSGTTWTIYINGAEYKTDTYSAIALDNTGFAIGATSQLTTGFRGLISDVRAWNIVRTQQQIFGAMLTRLDGTESGLAQYWPLDESSGSTATNRASSANGTVSGAMWTYSSDLPIMAAETPKDSWISATGGNWSETANWLNATVPQGVGSTAYFTNNPPAEIAVTNDLSGLLLGNLYIAGASGHTFTGNSVTLTNGLTVSSIVSANGANTLSLPLETTAPGLYIETLSPASFVIRDVISGAGNLTFNPPAGGGGTVTLTGTNTYSGTTAIGSGTLAIDSLANGGSPSSIGASPASAANLILGPGTLRYTGPAVETDRGLTIAPSSGRAAILSLDTNVTFGGSITAASGALIKRGKGTLTYAGPTSNVLGQAMAARLDLFAEYPANGDSPTNGFGSFQINEGKVVLGAPGQTNIIYYEAMIGSRTTFLPGQETTGELEISNGYTRVNSYLTVGRDNGDTTTAPAPLQPRLTISGGTLSLVSLTLGYAYSGQCNMRPVLDLRNGSLVVDDDVRIGDQRGSSSSPILATFNVFGGTFTHLSATRGLTFGDANPAGNSVFNLFGGLVDEPADLRMAQYGSRSDLNLHGGLLKARNIIQSNPGTPYGQSYLYFNGGVFQPRAEGYTLSGLTAATVSTNGAIIDTSLANYTVNQNLLHDPALSATADGGLIKLGANTLTLASSGSTLTGPIIVSNGTLKVTGALTSGVASVTVASGARFSISGVATQVVSASGLTLADGATLGLAFAANGASNNRLTVSSTPSLGNAQIALFVQDTDLPFALNGTYTLFTYSGAAPIVSGLTVANPVYGKLYAIAAADGAVTVTIGLDAASTSIWNVPAGGAWATASNWTNPPASAAGNQARFDSAISAPATVTTAGETAGGIYFNNLFRYTLGGSGLTLDNNGSPAVVSVESGSHTIAAPLTLTGDLSLSLLPSTLLNLGAVSGGTSSLSAQGGGILALTAAPAVQNLSLDVTELVFSNAMTVAPPVSLQRTTVLRPASNTAVTLNNVVSGSAGLTKSGSSTLTNVAANTYTGITTVNAGTLAASSLANGGLPSAVGASSSAAANLVIGPATLSYTGSAATTTRGLTTDPGNSKAAILSIDNDVTFGGEINAISGAFIKRGKGTLTYTGKGATGINTLGRVESSDKSGFTSFPANGDSPTAGFGSFVITDGKMILGAPGQTNYIYNESMVGLRTTNLAGKETTGELEIRDGYTSFSAFLSIGRNNGDTTTAPTPLHPRLTVSGGTLSIASGLILGYGNISGMNAQPILDITGGTLTTSGDFRLGDYRGTASPFATANMYGGIFRQTGTGFGIRFGGNGGADGVLNLFGGLVDTDSQVKMGLANAANISRLNLHGGVLRAQNITGSTGNEYLYFNGGVFQPRTAGQTLSGLTSATVSTNGAAFDTSLASFTVAQNLLHDTALGALNDGGLVKLGANTLSVTGTGNTFNGPIDVQAGLLQTRVPSTNDLTVATNAFFDAMSLRATVHDLRGYGTLTNGTIAVTGALDAGTNNAPAGARMTVQNLSLVGGSTFVCTWSTNALGQVTNDFVTVSGTLAPEGVGFFDLGRTVENPIPMPFKATVMSYASLSGNFAGWKAVNTGVSPSRHVATVVTAGGGLVTLEVRFGGTLVLLK